MEKFDLEKFLPYLLNQAAESASLAFQQVYRGRHAMTRSEWRVLAHLGQYGAMTARDISARARLHKTKISRAVFSLEKRRWLRRERRELDRRSEILNLTLAGRRVFLELGQAALVQDERLRASMGDDELTVLRRVLERLRGATTA